MKSFSQNLLKLSLVLLISSNWVKCRQLEVEVNPGCPNNCSEYGNPVNLVHIKSTGDNNIIHYLWSSITCIPPTLLIVESDLNSSLTINWNTLMKDVCRNPNPGEESDKGIANAIKIDGIINSIGFQFTRLFFFNDNNKKGSYDENDKILELSWDNLVWNNAVHSKKDSIRLTFDNCKESNTSLFSNGSIAFDLRIDGSDGRNDELPHLSFTEKSVSLEVNLIGVKTQDWIKSTNETERPRLMANIFVMTGGHTSKKVPEFESITSIDDEYTPGVFRRIVLDLKNGDKVTKDSFINWKPIGYNSNERKIANTLDIIHGEVEAFNTTELNEYKSRIFEAFFNLTNSSKLKFNLTFGASDDETYYNVNHVSSFSLVVGVDKAPDEELSFLVKIIIVIGFGLPLIVMIVSAMYIIVRKIRKRKFNDLLLSQSQQSLAD